MWVNPALTRMTGYTPEEVVGQNPHLFNSGQHTKEFFQRLWQTILTGQTWQGETTNRRKDGSLYIEEQTIAPVFDQHGEVSHFISIKQDISARKKAEEALLTRTEQLATMNRVMRTLTSSLDLHYVLPSLLRELGHVVPYDSAAIFQRGGDWLELIAGEGFADTSQLLGLTLHIADEHTPNHEVIRTLAPYIVADAPVIYPAFGEGVHALTPIRGWLGVPMVVGGRLIGMLTLNKYEPAFYTHAHAQLALAFAAEAAIAVENAHLYKAMQQELSERTRAEYELRQANEQLQIKLTEIEVLQLQLREQAIRDGLTGLFNRRFLEETLEREMARAARDQTALSVVMMDFDRFKSFNDTYGHRAGDRLLQALGIILRTQTRGGDVACRYGGEEFVVLLPGAQLAAAIQRAEQWRATCENLRIPYEDQQLGATLSLGVASFPAQANDAESLLIAADQALYAAKRNGRNQVVGYTPPTDPLK